MKILGIAAFTRTQAGRSARDLAGQLENSWQIIWYESNLKDWCRARFADASAILFISACGIAVRTIAPFLQSKTKDPAVLVMDEQAHHVISLVSGHIGGANELAEEIGARTGAVPVITTALGRPRKDRCGCFCKEERPWDREHERRKKDRGCNPAGRTGRRVLRGRSGGKLSFGACDAGKKGKYRYKERYCFDKSV